MLGGGDWALPDSGRLLLRLYGTDQNYRAGLLVGCGEPGDGEADHMQQVPTQQLGGVLQWAQTYKTLTFVAGADVVDTRATDNGDARGQRCRPADDQHQRAAAAGGGLWRGAVAAEELVHRVLFARR